MGLLMPCWALVALGLTVPLSGTVEDPAGKPVEGASVWLVDLFRKDPGTAILIEAKTDTEGKFRLDRPDNLAGRVIYWSPTVWAYKPGSRVAFVEFKRHVPRADEPVRLVLGPPARTPIRVLMPDGKPAPGAKVRPAQLHIAAPWPPAPLYDLIERTTDADGRAVLDGFRPEDVFRVDVAIEGFVTQRHSFTPPGLEEKTVSFRRVGQLSARFVADDPAIVRGWTLTAYTTPLEPDGLGGSTSWDRETSDAAGVVAFRPLAEGRTGWKVEPPKGSPYIAVMPPPVVVRAGELTEAKFTLRKGVTVEGTVVEEPGGAPVPGAEVTVVPLRYSGSIDTPSTDAHGRFSFQVLPNEFRFTLHKSPKTHYLPPGTNHWLDFVVKEGEERRVLAPFPMKRAAQIRGKVLDEAGEPESGAWVTAGWSVQEFRNGAQLSHRPTVYDTTDERGEFVLGSIAPGAEVRVSARTGMVAESSSETVTAGNGAEVTLRLKKHPALALSGRVLDPDGRPMDGVAVQIMIRSSNQNFDRGSKFTFSDKEVTTGPDGTFKTPAEVPVGHTYRVSVKAPGMEPAESAWIGTPAVAFPDLALRRGPRPPRDVTGRVVDTAGKPVTGAEVAQSGDGPRKTRDSTDADGRFKVPGIPATPAFLFVHKEGYRWTGRRVDPSDKAVEFVVIRSDEPSSAALKPAPSPISRAEERAIARDLLAPAWNSLRTGPEHTADRRKVQRAMALIDPDRVVGMIENQVLVADRTILANLALGRLEDSPRAAIEDLEAIGDPEKAAEALLSVFDRLAGASTLGLRRDLLDRALRRAREVRAHDQKVVLLAQVADRHFNLGDPGKATPIAREAAAPKPPEKPDDDDAAAPGVKRTEVSGRAVSVGGSSGVQSELAKALARVDLAAALKLIEGEKDGYSLDRLRSRLAVRVAATRPAEAKRLLGLIKNDSENGLARQLICIRMATTDLPTARAVSEVVRSPVLTAVLPAVAARELADSDPAKARALLKESFDRLGRLAEPSGANYANPPVIVMARLLPLAARIDPDRAPDYFWFTLASRPPLAAAPEQRPASTLARQPYANLAELAMLIARYDRSAAEVVFGPVAERVPGLLDEMWGLGNEGDAIFTAAAGYDARAAKVLVEALPEAPAQPANGNTIGPRPQHKTKANARIAIVRMLGLSPELRLREPLRRTGGDDWLPGLEDGSTVGDLP